MTARITGRAPRPPAAACGRPDPRMGRGRQGV